MHMRFFSLYLLVGIPGASQRGLSKVCCAFAGDTGGVWFSRLALKGKRRVVLCLRFPYEMRRWRMEEGWLVSFPTGPTALPYSVHRALAGCLSGFTSYLFGRSSGLPGVCTAVYVPIRETLSQSTPQPPGHLPLRRRGKQRILIAPEDS